MASSPYAYTTAEAAFFCSYLRRCIARIETLSPCEERSHALRELAAQLEAWEPRCGNVIPFRRREAA